MDPSTISCLWWLTCHTHRYLHTKTSAMALRGPCDMQSLNQTSTRYHSMPKDLAQRRCSLNACWLHEWMDAFLAALLTRMINKVSLVFLMEKIQSKWWNKLELFNLPVKTSYHDKSCFLIQTQCKKRKTVVGKEKKIMERVNFLKIPLTLVLPRFPTYFSQMSLCKLNFNLKNFS